jgi:type I restriction enzyme S subunit
MSFPRYPAYKDSGVEWLGAVPQDWIVTPIKHLGRLKGGAGFPHHEQGLVGEEMDFHKVGSLGQSAENGYLLPSENTISRSTALKLGAFIFPEGTLIFAKVGAALFLGRIRQLAAPACIDNNMMGLVVSQKDHDPAFVRYAMHLVRFDLIANPGAVPSLNEGQIGEFALVSPPTRAEQIFVASFLDRETAKIDALVAEQEQLITLLKEKRQAVISHAVTRGLDPSVPMKDSGVEWLGEVPAHWEIKKVSLSFRAKKGSNAAALTKEYCATIEGEYPVYSGQTENAGVMASISSYEFDADEAGVLFSTTVGAKAMTMMHVFGKFSLSQNCMIIAPIVDLHVRFFFYHMQPLFQYERGLIPEHMQASFRMEDLYAYRIATPPFDEQVSIAKFLNERCAAFDALIDEAGKNVVLLQERRSALISAAVTGQIDVRGLANASTT